jgi:hypothetical protein
MSGQWPDLGNIALANTRPGRVASEQSEETREGRGVSGSDYRPRTSPEGLALRAVAFRSDQRINRCVLFRRFSCALQNDQGEEAAHPRRYTILLIHAFVYAADLGGRDGGALAAYQAHTKKASEFPTMFRDHSRGQL